MLSDTELIESCVEDSIRGREALLANKLRFAECRFGTNQLMSKQAGLLAKVSVKEQPPQFWVRQSTPNQALLDELLQRHQFVGSGQPDGEGFVSYEYLPVKQGYTLNRQPARALWKNWRTLYRMQENMAKAQKLLVKGGHDWEEVKKITVSNQLMFIETAEGETVSHMDDAIAWLSEGQTEEATARVTPARARRTESTGENIGFPTDAF
ncbi:MAG: hypothetical protein AAFQ61_10935 [Cyanobacteria bacterium J06626_23]